MIPFKWNLEDQWFPGTNTGGWGNLRRGKRKLRSGGHVLYDDCGGGGDVLVMYTVHTFDKTHWTLHVSGCILCLNYTLIKLFLRKKAQSPTVVGYGFGHWHVLQTPYLYKLLDKAMTVFSSEKPAQLFLKRRAQWKRKVCFLKMYSSVSMLKIWGNL